MLVGFVTVTALVGLTTATAAFDKSGQGDHTSQRKAP
jgi:hypothetical protein